MQRLLSGTIPTKALMSNDDNGTFVVAGLVTFLYFELQYRDEVTVWTARDLSSFTGKVQEIFLVDRAFRSAGKGEIFTVICSSHNLNTTCHRSE